MTTAQTPRSRPHVAAFEAARRDGFIVYRGRAGHSWPRDDAHNYYDWCRKERRPYVEVREWTKYATVRINMDPCSTMGEVGLTDDDTGPFRRRWYAMPGIKDDVIAVCGWSGGTWHGIPIPLARAFASDLYRVAVRRAACTERYDPLRDGTDTTPEEPRR